MPMHFFSMLQTLKLFLEIISAGSDFLGHIYITASQSQQFKRFVCCHLGLVLKIVSHWRTQKQSEYFRCHVRRFKCDKI